MGKNCGEKWTSDGRIIRRSIIDKWKREWLRHPLWQILSQICTYCTVSSRKSISSAFASTEFLSCSDGESIYDQDFVPLDGFKNPEKQAPPPPSLTLTPLHHETQPLPLLVKIIADPSKNLLLHNNNYFKEPITAKENLPLNTKKSSTLPRPWTTFLLKPSRAFRRTSCNNSRRKKSPR